MVTMVTMVTIELVTVTCSRTAHLNIRICIRVLLTAKLPRSVVTVIIVPPGIQRSGSGDWMMVGLHLIITSLTSPHFILSTIISSRSGLSKTRSQACLQLVSVVSPASLF